MSVLRVLTAPYSLLQAVRAAAVGLALVAGGCASQQSGGQAATQGVAHTAGLVSPAQREPSDAAAEEAKEPWSPHYGWRPNTGQFSPSYLPVQVERVSTTPGYATMDPDAVIRHAVAAHEMRRQ